MGMRVVTTAFGSPALAALSEAVAAAKADDPLAPVTVVVPSNLAGLSVRRSIASAPPAEGRRPGLAGVTFVSFPRLVGLLGSARLAGGGKQPMSGPLVAGALAGALATQPGAFAEVADHPATQRALADVYADLRALPVERWNALAKFPGVRGDLGRLLLEARGRLDDYYDDRDLIDAARAAVFDGSIPTTELGSVLVHLPVGPPDGEMGLLVTLAETVDVTVIVGFTGDAAADATARALVERLGGDGAPDAVDVVAATGTHVLTATDPDEEVRSALRFLLARLADGVPWHRMALLHTTREPYARIAHEQLSAAGLPFAGRSPRSLSDSLPGRTLLMLLGLPESEFRRDDVIALCASVPVLRLDGRSAPDVAWDRLSRKAGVVGGLEQWHDRLGRRAAWLRARAEVAGDDDRDGDDPDGAAAERDERDAWMADELIAFVDELHRRLALEPPETWQAVAPWACDLLRRVLGGTGRRSDWSEADLDAADEVDDLIAQLGRLDEVGAPSPTLRSIRELLQVELEAPGGRGRALRHRPARRSARWSGRARSRRGGDRGDGRRQLPCPVERRRV